MRNLLDSRTCSYWNGRLEVPTSTNREEMRTSRTQPASASTTEYMFREQSHIAPVPERAPEVQTGFQSPFDIVRKSKLSVSVWFVPDDRIHTRARTLPYEADQK